jgi:hypothetical protein
VTYKNSAEVVTGYRVTVLLHSVPKVKGKCKTGLEGKHSEGAKV